MADQNGAADAHAEPMLVSSASTQPSQTVVQAPTAAVIGKVITSGSQSGSQDNRSRSSAKSTQSALTERRRRKAQEAAQPRPWPDDRKYNPRSL